jgi:ribosomal-protein-alanine N-acetyltransferase
MRLFPFKQAALFVRPLTRGDAAACAQIHASAFAHPWSGPDILDMLAHDSTFGDVGSGGARQKPRGFILSRLAADEAEVLTVAVDRRWRRRGVARALLQRNIARAAAAGAREMFLEVDVENAGAIALYARFGFQVVGRRDGYYRRATGAKAAAQIMRARLT